MKTTVSKWACNFCGRTEDEVADLIVATFKLAICDECVATCTEIIAEARRSPGKLLAPLDPATEKYLDMIAREIACSSSTTLPPQEQRGHRSVLA
ncbi:ClpX C4-type zinc finger protein, partial [Burkholderia multivorans]|uniref:ClpX C4-type zinc finger protein n=1 Tax=Burkholderia multivorans TaxID=87883 RepID=UPI001C20F740